MVGNKTILTWCCEPGIVPGSLHALPHSPQNTTEKDFTDEETGVQRGWLTCSESHSYIEAEPSFNLAQTDPNSCPVHASCCSLLSDPCIYIHFGPWPSSVYVKCSRMSVGLSFPLGDPSFVKGWTPVFPHHLRCSCNSLWRPPQPHFLCSQRFLRAGLTPAKMVAPAPGTGGDPDLPVPVPTNSRGNSVK